jgi:hypothetical protein
MKTCDHPGCHYPVFSKSLCQLHWKLKHGKPLPKYTDKRKTQIDEYHNRRRQFIAERRAEGKGKLWCPFCSDRIYGNPAIHHTMGKDDETLLDEKYWHIGHSNCHVQQFHSMSWKDIPWWLDYVKWVKENMPPEVYLKLKKREEKL